MKKQHEPSYPIRVRQKWYFLVDKLGKSVKDLCAEYAIARKTYYKWYEHDNGDRRHIPIKEHPNTKLTREIKIFIEEQKLRTNYGPKKMKKLIERKYGLIVSTTILYRYYKKKGLIRRPQKKLLWYTPLKEPVRVEKPGDCVQLDIKYVWIDGKRIYQRTFSDVYTGMQYFEYGQTKDDDLTITAFVNAQKFFPFKIIAIQTDNGGEFRGTFHAHLGTIGIAHYFIPKRSPYWNGVVERAHGVVDQEYYLNPLRQWKTAEEYLTYYNYERLHDGKNLNCLTPFEKFEYYQSSVTSRC
ncbi:MAG: DDE-type integrase/transposase/recombinase [Patescibacteria group bacterium]